MEDRVKHGKRKYAESYVRNDAGEFEYTGKLYAFDLSKPELIRMKRVYSFLALATAAAFLAAGFLNNDGSRVIYVVLPYVSLFLPIAFMLSDVYKIAAAKGNMTQKQYDHSIVQLKNVSVAAVTLSFISSAGDIFFIMSGRVKGHLSKEMLFLTLSVVIFALNVISINVQSKMSAKIRSI